MNALRTAAVVAALVPFHASAFVQGQSPDHYDVKLKLLPEIGHLQAEAVVTLNDVPDGADSFSFCLNGHLELLSASSETGVRDVRRDDERKGTCPFSPLAVPVTVWRERSLDAAAPVALHLAYAGGIEMDPWTTNRLTQEWIELGLYSSWFPRFPGRERFTYEVEVQIDAGYVLTGTGNPTFEDGFWRFTSTEATFDIVVMGSRTLRRSVIEKGEARASIYHTGLDEAQVEEIARDANAILHHFTDWFGPTAGSDVTMALAPRGMGGGYARPGLIVMAYENDPSSYPWLVKSLAHEFAHFWWSGAPVTTWEDWLNEAFAEYAALMLVRELYGAPALQSYLDEYRLKADGAPPIRGIARGSEHAYSVLYFKGAMLLYELERRLGRDSFTDLLRTLATERIRQTDDLLARVETLTSRETRAWIEEALDR